MLRRSAIISSPISVNPPDGELEGLRITKLDGVKVDCINGCDVTDTAVDNNNQLLVCFR